MIDERDVFSCLHSPSATRRLQQLLIGEPDSESQSQKETRHIHKSLVKEVQRHVPESLCLSSFGNWFRFLLPVSRSAWFKVRKTV